MNLFPQVINVTEKMLRGKVTTLPFTQREYRTQADVRPELEACATSLRQSRLPIPTAWQEWLDHFDLLALPPTRVSLSGEKFIRLPWAAKDFWEVSEVQVLDALWERYLYLAQIKAPNGRPIWKPGLVKAPYGWIGKKFHKRKKQQQLAAAAKKAAALASGMSENEFRSQLRREALKKQMDKYL